jgi:hypothetical protein
LQPFATGTIKPKHIESLLKEHSDIIEEHSWITADLMDVPELKIKS